jgi:hypothetical protein
LSAAAVTTMVSVGLYGQQSFLDFRLLLSKSRRGCDYGVGARFLFGDILAQRIGRFARCR